MKVLAVLFTANLVASLTAFAQILFTNQVLTEEAGVAPKITASLSLGVSPRCTSIISQVGDQTLRMGDYSEIIEFVIDNRKTPAGELVLTATSSNQTLLPDDHIQLGGSGANRALVYQPVWGVIGQTVITISSREEDGCIASTSFTVTVLGRPAMLRAIPDQVVPQGGSTGPLLLVFQDATTFPIFEAFSAESSNPEFIPVENVVFGQDGQNRTVRVTPLPRRIGRSRITICAKDAFQQASSTSFFVTTTNTPPTISITTTQWPTLRRDIAIPVTVGDHETPAEDLVLTATSSESFWLPSTNFTFCCGVTTRFLKITPPRTYFPTGVEVTVTVTDGDGASASSAFWIWDEMPCQAPPVIYGIPDQKVAAGSLTAPIPLTAYDCSDWEATFKFFATSMNTNLVRNANLFFYGPSRQQFLVAAPEPDQSGTCEIWVVAVTRSGFSTSAARWTLTVERQTGPPTIVSQPQSQTSFYGEKAFLAVGMEGSAPFAYQWLRNGDALDGATNAFLVLPSLDRTSVGDYSVLVTNGAGTITSQTAQVRGRAINAAFDLRNGLQVQTTGTAGESYQVLTSCDLRTWFPLLTTTNQTGVAVFTDPDALRMSQRFYRILPTRH